MTDTVHSLFDAAEAAGYDVYHGRQQVMLRHCGRKVGGWNTTKAMGTYPRWSPATTRH